MDRMKRKKLLALFFMLCFLLHVTACTVSFVGEEDNGKEAQGSLEDIPEFSGEPYVVIHGNEPEFPEKDKKKDSFETYGELDSLGRCTQAYANIGVDLMPKGDRGSINGVKPTGWSSVKYKIVEGRYLYNRCHLIGYQLTGENANRENLITGTRYLNIEGMLPFENMVAEYIEETENHVLYRVTPVFEGDELVARGVQMEALSVEDDGEGVCFNIYAYNCQPGIAIDYETGDSELSGETAETGGGKTEEKPQEYILNTSTKKFHLPSCQSGIDTKEENKQTVKETRSKLLEDGYEPCGRCKP